MNNLNIQLISENYVKERSTVMDNVENIFIRNNILLSQDIYLQDIIGSKLYDDIISQFEDYKTAYDAGTAGIAYSDYVDANYLTLVDNYIQPCLLYYTLYESSDDLYMKFTNKGIVTQTSDYSNTIGDEMFYKRKAGFLNKAEFYAKRLTNYLIDNHTTYTKYYESISDYSDNYPNEQSYLSNGWYLKTKGCQFKSNDIF